MLLVLSIGACGFQLRGALQLPEDISPIYLQDNSIFELAREIRSLLLSNNILIVENDSKANSQLTLLDEVKDRRVLSVDTNGQVREYLLIYRVSFSIKIKQQEEVNESVSISRSLLFDSNAVLAATHESGVIYKNMLSDASRLILSKLQAHANKVTGANNSTSKQTGNLDPQ